MRKEHDGLNGTSFTNAAEEDDKGLFLVEAMSSLLPQAEKIPSQYAGLHNAGRALGWEICDYYGTDVSSITSSITARVCSLQQSPFHHPHLARGPEFLLTLPDVACSSSSFCMTLLHGRTSLATLRSLPMQKAQSTTAVPVGKYRFSTYLIILFVCSARLNVKI